MKAIKGKQKATDDGNFVVARGGSCECFSLKLVMVYRWLSERGGGSGCGTVDGAQCVSLRCRQGATRVKPV